jgi:hypothetical protein
MAKFHHEHDENLLPDFRTRTQASLNTFIITRETVRNLLLGLDLSKGGSEDGISNRMLKLVVTSIDVPLTRLFNLFLEHGSFPSCWKLGIIVPVFKNKEPKSCPGNYRPVTLLNALSKIFERALYSPILDHLLRNNLLYERQSGFLPGHDTQKQLVSIVHQIVSNFDSGLVTRGVFLDIAAAFDSVPHFLLILKLRAYGIGGDLLELISSYLRNRWVKVKVNSTYSDDSPNGFINSGVPQGSILGPLLFLIYINDLSDVVHHCTLFLYADDSSLFCAVDPNEDLNITHNLIQNDLDNLAAWSRKWKLEFKASKCKEVVFHSVHRDIENYAPLNLNAEVIQRNTSHKHLGVILDECLSFNVHLTKVITRCNNMLNPLKALKTYVHSKHLERMYMSFILPHLEYGSIIFASSYQNLLAQLDRIHYRAAVLVSGCVHGSNSHKVLKCLDWPTLADRRELKRLSLMYEVTHNVLPPYLGNLFDNYRNLVPDRRLRIINQFRLPARMSRRMQKSTVPSAIRSWSVVPNEVKESLTKSSFKYKARTYLCGNKNKLVTPRLNLMTRADEISLNRIRADLIFNSHYFNHNFDRVNDPSCICGNRLQSSKHLLLHCPLFAIKRRSLLDDLGQLPSFNPIFRNANVTEKLGMLIHGHSNIPTTVNKLIVSSAARFVSDIVQQLENQP